MPGATAWPLRGRRICGRLPSSSRSPRRRGSGEAPRCEGALHAAEGSSLLTKLPWTFQIFIIARETKKLADLPPPLFNGDALCQIPRLVDVTPTQHPDVVSQQLQGYDQQDRREIGAGNRDRDTVIREGRHLRIACVEQGYHLAAPALHFLDIRDDLLMERIRRGKNDDRHLLVDQRDGPVFH